MDKVDFPSIYRNSRIEAERLGEMELWWESFHNNVACARHIEAAIHGCFDDTTERLKPGCAESVLAVWGAERVNMVLANKLQDVPSHLWHLYSGENLDWGGETQLPPDTAYRRYYVADSSAGLVVNANLKMSIFAETKCHFSATSIVVYTALFNNFTYRHEACQALIYQLVLGLTGENGKYNYSKAVHVYPPFSDITSSAKNYKIALALTVHNGKASDCIRCGKCEHACPQHLPIRDLLVDVAKEFEK